MKHLAMAVLYDPSNALARGLMGLVAYQGKWTRPDEVSRQGPGRPRAQGARCRSIYQRRAKTSESAEDQWKLALWCEQNGLKDQAIAQYHAVLRRDPIPRVGLEAVGLQESRRPLDQAGVAGDAEARDGAAEPGQQALEAATGAVARWAVRAGTRPGEPTPRRPWRRCPTRVRSR